MVSSSTTHLPIPYLLPFSTKSHGFNYLAYGPLFSARQACDHNCTAFFDNNSVIFLSKLRSILICFFHPQLKVTAMHHHKLFIQCPYQLTHHQYKNKIQP